MIIAAITVCKVFSLSLNFIRFSSRCVSDKRVGYSTTRPLRRARLIGCAFHELRDNLPQVMELTEKKIQQEVNDLHAIIARMLPFEQKYGLLSADFYTLYQSGQLDTGENLRDVTLWAGAYEMKLKLEEVARRLSQQRLAQLRADSLGAEVRLAPDQQAVV
ncbi:MAG: hypothetical protein ACREEM_25490 [Blastocatellia bacterium]